MSDGPEFSSAPKRKVAQGGGDEWLVTYSDEITLLMAFFVMMFSISKVDPANFEHIRSIIKAEVGKQPVTQPFSTVYDQMKEVLEDISDKDKVKVQRIPKGILLEFTSSVMFAPGSARLKPEMHPVLKNVAAKINGLTMKSFSLVVEGHTDPSPTGRGKFRSNWDLSAMRATATLNVLLDEGVAKERCQVRAFADTRPIKPNHDLTGEPLPENAEANRRVVIRVER